MLAIVFAPSLSMERRLLRIAAMNHMKIQASATLQTFSTSLYRDPDAVGLLACTGYASAVQHVSRIRMGDIRNHLLVFFTDIDLPFGGATARAEVLAAGADDAQLDTIDDREVLARLQAVMRRGDYLDHTKIRFRDCVYDCRTRLIRTPRGTVQLSLKEAGMLTTIATSRGRLVSKAELMDVLYGDDEEPAEKIIDVFMCKLRKKVLYATRGYDIIQTCHGTGFRFVPEGYEPRFRLTRYRGGAAA